MCREQSLYKGNLISKEWGTVKEIRLISHFVSGLIKYTLLLAFPLDPVLETGRQGQAGVTQAGPRAFGDPLCLSLHSRPCRVLVTLPLLLLRQWACIPSGQRRPSAFFSKFYFERTLDLRKSCKNSRYFPYTPFPATLVVNIILNSGNFIEIRKLVFIVNQLLLVTLELINSYYH